MIRHLVKTIPNKVRRGQTKSVCFICRFCIKVGRLKWWFEPRWYEGNTYLLLAYVLASGKKVMASEVFKYTICYHWTLSTTLSGPKKIQRGQKFNSLNLLLTSLCTVYSLEKFMEKRCWKLRKIQARKVLKNPEDTFGSLFQETDFDYLLIIFLYLSL